MIEKFKNVLVFAAHHDDETIGCGATLSKLSDFFANITVVFFTNGSTGIDQSLSYASNIITTRQNESVNALKTLGVKNIVDLNYPCQKLNNTQDVLHNTISLIREYKPDLILTHSKHDFHRDHRAVYEITRESYYKSYENIHGELGKCHEPMLGLTYEVLEPHSTIDISVEVSENDVNKKIEAFRNYKSQQDLLTENITSFMKSLSVVRGFQNNKKYCESFQYLCNNKLTL